MLKKLRRKLVLVNMAIVILLLALAFGLVYHLTQKNLEQESLRMMQAAVSMPPAPGRPGKNLQELRLPCFVIRMETGGRLTANGAQYLDLSDQSFLRDLMEIAFSSSQPTGVAEEYGLRFLRSEGQRNRWAVFADLSVEQTTLSNLLQICLGIGVLIFLLFFGVSIFLARWMIQPIEQAWTQQRQFVADASHELKTPLTVIQTSAELLQNLECPVENQRQFSNNILTMTRQMRRLVERLLELARWDSGQNQLDFSLTDLSVLIKNNILPFEAVFFERGLRLFCQVTEGIFVHGNAQQLRQVLDILLDNAQKYTAPNGQVWVTLKRISRSRCRLSVANTGQPIPQEELTRIFQRFYRADKARSRDGSFGLGLSIAENLVQQHRGMIWAESKDGVNYFFVELPAPPHGI